MLDQWGEEKSPMEMQSVWLNADEEEIAGVLDWTDCQIWGEETCEIIR